MDNLIKIINTLQDNFAELETAFPIDLPQIAVVGEQSAGKSSVLENFVGRDFLPRGSGIVTRRPLVLQMIYHNGVEYAEFLHCKGKKFTDFLQVREEIEIETDRVTGKNKNISPIPINLRVYSPNVLNLTLIDLPGLTKVPVGDQPVDIEQQIRAMIIQFISNPTCLILAVTSAVNDLANSEALKLSREIDPQGLRTIGVVTKIDMMDQGTNCVAILSNKTYPLIRGYIGIVNRSQKDIESRRDIKSAQDSEMKFFLSHPAYKHMTNKIGSKYLQQNLHQQLSKHILDTMPTLRDNLMAQQTKIQNEIDANKDIYDIDESSSARTRIFMTKIQEISREVDAILGYLQDTVSLEELSSGWKISKVINQKFIIEMGKVKLSAEDVKREIKIAIQNAQGVRQSLFSASSSFNAVIKYHIESTRKACLTICDMVAREVREMLENIMVPKFKMFPYLLNEVMVFALHKIDKFHQEAKNRTNFLVDIQVSHINTSHPDFIDMTAEEYSSDSRPNGSGMKAIAGLESIIHKQGLMYRLKQGALKQSKEQYFVLKGQVLNCYSDQFKKNLKDVISLENCGFKEYERSNKYYITCYRKDGNNIIRNVKYYELQCLNAQDHDEWKVAFIAAGLEIDDPDYLDSSRKKTEDFEGDVALIKQIEYVYVLVDTYRKIVIKSEIDTVAKICVHCIVSQTRDLLFTDIISFIFANGSLDELMTESEEIKDQKTKSMRLLKSCRSALSVIENFMNTSTANISSLSNVPALNKQESEQKLQDYTYEISSNTTPQPLVTETLNAKENRSASSHNVSQVDKNSNLSSLKSNFYVGAIENLSSSENNLNQISQKSNVSKPSRPPPKPLRKAR